MRPRKSINASAKQGKTIGILADVTITAAEMEGDKPKGPPTFSVTAYNGGPLDLDGWDMPTVVDLAGLQPRKAMVANLDHKATQRVGNVNGVVNDQKTLVLSGSASAHTAHRDEVVASAADGFQWQASIEATPGRGKGDIEFLKAGKTATVNAQIVTGPAYIVRKSTLKGFAFVSHGADDSTVVNIAAAAASSKEKDMDKKFKAWLEAEISDADTLEAVIGNETLLAGWQAMYDRENTPKKKTKLDPDGNNLDEVLAAKKQERERRKKIQEIAADFCDDAPSDMIPAIQARAQLAIDEDKTADRFELEMRRELQDFMPKLTITARGATEKMTNEVIEAAICMSGGLGDIDKHFSDKTLSAAEKQFKGGIGLKQLWMLAAEANGYRGGYSSEISLECQRAAFGYGNNHREIRANFSTIQLPDILSASANKFLEQGWLGQDMTWQRISGNRPLRNFQTHNTYRLSGTVKALKLGPGGEIKHGTLTDDAYTLKADTYGIMLGITRQDLMNDDLGALTQIPMELGMGCNDAMNELFWTTFLNNTGSFFTAGNANVNTGVATVTTAGLSATEVIFANQTKPNGTPLGIQGSILLVPPTLRNTALQLMNSTMLIDGTSTAVQGSTNVMAGRYRVESSPYMENTALTGYSTAAWYLLADPSRFPVIQVGFVNNRSTPFIESADAPFSSLGAQMRAYFDPAVSLHEYRFGVRADGGSS